jgi:hypothetical protein
LRTFSASPAGFVDDARSALPGKQFKSAALVGRDMIGPVAFDFVLRALLRCVMRVALVIEVSRMNSDDGSGHLARFGMPSDVIADPEPLSHVANFSFSQKDVL